MRPTCLLCSFVASERQPLTAASPVAHLELSLPPAAAFTSLTGRGVTARVGDRNVVVGRPSLLAESGFDTRPLAGQIEVLEDAGRTVVGVCADDGVLLGALALGDELRPDAAPAVAALKAAGVTPVLLTGDNPRAAAQMAARAGIEVVHAGALPGGKADIVRKLQRRGRVAMVGDGINDAPALMQADVGVAMGGGTDIAMESADAIILNSRLTAVLTVREISLRSYRKTRQNVALAFLFNGIGVLLAATGILYPVWAMAAMAVSVTSIFAKRALHLDAVALVTAWSAPMTARVSATANPHHQGRGWRVASEPGSAERGPDECGRPGASLGR